MAIIPSSPDYWLKALRDTIVGLILTAAFTTALVHFVVPALKNQLVEISGLQWQAYEPNDDSLFNPKCDYRWTTKLPNWTDPFAAGAFAGGVDLHPAEKSTFYPSWMTETVLVSLYRDGWIFVGFAKKNEMTVKVFIDRAEKETRPVTISLERRCS
jgi:hypothetical protein